MYISDRIVCQYFRNISFSQEVGSGGELMLILPVPYSTWCSLKTFLLPPHDIHEDNLFEEQNAFFGANLGLC